MRLKPSMFVGASPEMMQRAKELRANATEAEIAFWNLVSNKKFHGLKFRRQHPLAIFIADFYCHSIRLVVEIDGEIHRDMEVSKQDTFRQQQINEMGLRLIRFTNDEVLKHPDIVLRKLTAQLGTQA